MSDATIASPSITADDVWVKFRVRYHRHEPTLRDAFVGMISKLSKNNGKAYKDFWALSELNVKLRPGDTLGLAGHNGAGKTTFLKTLAGICTPDRGFVNVRGKVSCLMSFGVGFKANLSGRENAYLNGSLLGLSQSQMKDVIEEIVEFSELDDFIDAPVRTYSAGMKGRLGFSIAVHVKPDVLLLDEVLSVGDASFRAKAGSILDRFRSENKTVVLATHNMDLLRKQCTRVLWLEHGRVVMDGDPKEVTDAYVADAKKKRAEKV